MIGLFEDKEPGELLAPIKKLHREQLSVSQYMSVCDVFVSRVVQDLFLVLGLEPHNARYANNYATNPSLMTMCCRSHAPPNRRFFDSVKDLDAMLELSDFSVF